MVPSETGELLTIGHSTRSLDELVAILREAATKLLVDVRKVPRSRRTPQFNREVPERALPRRGITYSHCAALGGLRRGLGATSPSTGWRDQGFRASADYKPAGGSSKRRWAP